jgi:hypothetical protein
MQHIIRGHPDRRHQPCLSIADGAGVSPTSNHLTLDQTLEQCLLDAQRQVHRLEEIVHRLKFGTRSGAPPSAGALSLIQESNRRLTKEVDEFVLDSHAVLSLARLPSTGSGVRHSLTAGSPQPQVERR